MTHVDICGWRKPEIHEALATLYLRLNGYFTTGLIVHSPDWGANRTETDCLAVREQHHCQPERGIETSEFLATSSGEVDLVICEVKSVPEERFNESLRNDPETIRSLLRWAGLFDERQVCSVAERLQPLFDAGVDLATARNGVLEGRCRVRALLSCPPASEQDCQGRWCLVGSEILRFADECFSPAERRPACSTRYNFRQWGYALAPIVQYFKLSAGGDPSTLEGLYAHLGVRPQQ